MIARKERAIKWRAGGVAEWLKAADCKSARVAYVGSNPTPTTTANLTTAWVRGMTVVPAPASKVEIIWGWKTLA